MNHLRIAIIGRLGTPQLACLRSWRRHGVRCLFLHADSAPLSATVRWLLGVPCVHLGPLQLDDPAYVQRLSDALAEHGIQALTCVSEPISEALWACQPHLPPELRIVSVHPEQCRLLASKVQQDRAAREAGLDTLPGWTYQPGETVDVPVEHFPLVLRPDVARTVSPAFKVAVVTQRDEFQQLLDGLARSSSGVIAQPLVHGPNLLVHAYRSADGRCAGHVGFRVEVKHQGLTVVMRPVQLDASIIQGCERMERSLGLTGVFHYDFIEDAQTGRACFLDLNPRLGGTTGKVLSAGYDEPLALLATLQPGVLPRSGFVQPGMKRAGGKHQALRALLSALRGTSTAADYPYPNRSRLVGALLGYLFGGRDEIVKLRELRSTLGFGLYKLGKRGA
jgi:predicted ATP-grasp superfamily ATP-dependent carboligase